MFTPRSRSSVNRHFRECVTFDDQSTSQGLRFPCLCGLPPTQSQNGFFGRTITSLRLSICAFHGLAGGNSRNASRPTHHLPSTKLHFCRSVPHADFMTDGAMIDRFEENGPKRYRDETAPTFQRQTGRSLTATGFDRDAVQSTVGSSRASSTTTCSPASSTTLAHELASCGSMLTSVA